MSATDQSTAPLVISVDAMGGDEGPAPIVAGLARFLRQDRDAHILLHGPKAELEPLIAKRKLTKSVTIIITTFL